MIDYFLFIGLPYTAVAVALVATVYRARAVRFSYSAQSSQILESNKLLWGSLPWHIGILMVLPGHVMALTFPHPWHRLVKTMEPFFVMKAAGFGMVTLCLTGIVVLLARRLTTRRLWKSTTPMDMCLLALLLFQVLLGTAVAITFGWGSTGAAGPLSPYLRSLLTLHPDPSYVAGYPLVVKAHVVGAWLIVLVLPFSRLIHMLALPWQYLFRLPQRVIWSNKRRFSQS